MLVRVLVCIALIDTTPMAAWQRSMSGGGHGGFPDSPPPHPLAYFNVDPCLRPSSDRLVSELDCTSPGAPPPSPAEAQRRANTSTDLVEIGEIGAFTIYDLWYTRGIYTAYPGPDFRSVLVKTGADQYREIDVQARLGFGFPSSEIVTLDGEGVLIVKYHDGGQHLWVDEMRYVFRQGGPERADFSAVADAAGKLVPANMSIRTWANDYDSMKYEAEFYRSDLNLPPVTVTQRGRVTVTYRFIDGRAVVTSSKYEPYSLE